MMDAKTFLKDLTDSVSQAFERNRRLLSFDQFVEAFHEHPERHGRSAVQYMRDCFLHYGYSEQEEVWGKSTHFHLFDAPFEEGSEPMVGHQASQVRVFRLLENFVRSGRIDKLILLHGPNGSAKSTFVKTIMRALEHYSQQDEGALYCFNWVFPSERITQQQAIGFSSTAQEVDPSSLSTFAFLGEDQIDAKLSGSMRDHPLLLIPLQHRQALLDRCAESDDIAWGDYLYKGELSHTNRMIFDALLMSYKGDLASVFKHIQVERFYISRRYRRGAVTIEPQMRADAGVRQLTVDRSLNALPPSLQNITLFDAVGDLVDANRGVIEYDDLFKRHPDLNKYLLSASERAAVSLDDRNLFLDLVLLATGNEMYLDAFKQSPEYASFKGRIELVRLPYLLNYEDEQRIYDQHLSSVDVGKPIAPHTTYVAALWAVLTRLKRPGTDTFAANVRDMIGALTPIEKADLYARGEVPDRLGAERARELKLQIQALFDDGAQTTSYEGRFGASPREMKMILLNASQHDKFKTLSPLAVFEELQQLVKDKSVFPFLQLKPDGPYFQPETFISTVRERYLDVLDVEVRMAMGLVDESQYNQLFARYIDHVSQSIKGEKVKNDITGQYEDPDTQFMEQTEALLGVEEDHEAFRQGLISSIAAYSIDNPGAGVDYQKIFGHHFESLKESFFDDRVQTIEKIQTHILRVLADDVEGLTTQERQTAQQAIDTLQRDYGYPAESIREVVAFLVANRYNES